MYIVMDKIVTEAERNRDWDFFFIAGFERQIRFCIYICIVETAEKTGGPVSFPPPLLILQTGIMILPTLKFSFQLAFGAQKLGSTWSSLAIIFTCK